MSTQLSLIERIAECGRLAVRALQNHAPDLACDYFAEWQGLNDALEGRFDQDFLDNPLLQQSWKERYLMGYQDGSKLKELEEARVRR
jgi:hypothetical protein